MSEEYLAKVMAENEVRDSIRCIRHEAEEIVTRAKRAFALLCTETNASPAMRRGYRLDLEAFRVLTGLLNLLITFACEEHFEVKPAELRSWILQSCETIREFHRGDWETSVGLHKPPWETCQIRHGRVENEYILHNGTGHENYGGSSSGSWTCDGPLRTEEESKLGMCGSCLKRFGPRLGTHVP